MSADRYEFMTTTAGGCHTGLRPLALSESQYAWGVNITSRGGVAATRPPLQFVANLTGSGDFNGAGMYRLNSADRLVYGIAGAVRVLNLSTLADAPLGAMDANAQLHFSKADRYFIVQDGVNRPLFVYEDALLRRALDYRALDGNDPENTYNEVFTGLATAYGHGRVFTVARHIHGLDGQPVPDSEGRPYFVAGDIVSPEDPQDALRFTETSYLSGGAAAVQPLEMGFITALAFYRNAQTGTGQGPLVSLAQNGLAAYSVNMPRDSWGGLDFSQVLFFGPGCRSPWGVSHVNDDLLFRARDGIRSLRYTVSGEAGGSGKLSATPISGEVSRFLDLDDDTDLPYASLAYAGNRLLVTASGRENGAFRSLVSMDTAVAYSLTSTPPPIYDGIWTGLQVVAVLAGTGSRGDTHYLVAKTPTGHALWKVGDGSGTDHGARPLCRIYTREYSFGGVQSKRFGYGELYLSGITGDVDVTLYYRADSHALWSPCSATRISAAPGSLPQTRFRVRLSPSEADAYDCATGKHLQLGSSFQFCIEWKGRATLEKALFRADYVTDDAPEVCVTEETGELLSEGESGISLDDYVYDVYSEIGDSAP